MGKIIEINSFGKINRILALGLRNPTSLYLKEKNIFITVIGPQSGDEINNLNSMNRGQFQNGMADDGLPQMSFNDIEAGFNALNYEVN